MDKLHKQVKTALEEDEGGPTISLGNVSVVCITLLFILCLGEPDILDGLIAIVHSWSK